MIAASLPTRRSAEGRLLVVDGRGAITHHARTEFSALVREGDVVVANDAATLPASLAGMHLRSGQAVEVRLAGRDSLRPDDVIRFTAIVFGAGDYRTPTEERAAPPALRPGDVLRLGPLRATVLALLGHPRLVALAFQSPAAEVWESLARHGRPIQYAYVPQPLAIWDTWTQFAALPAAFEAPSAGFFACAERRSSRSRTRPASHRPARRHSTSGCHSTSRITSPRQRPRRSRHAGALEAG
jgi:S-adenosylmethionine:tRNA ribosyltransferase-isomerase